MRKFTDDAHDHEDNETDVDDVDSTDNEPDAEDDSSDDNEPDDDESTEPIAETVVKLTVAEKTAAAAATWQAAVSAILEGERPDASTTAASFAPLGPKTGSMNLDVEFGRSMTLLVANGQAENIPAVALYKNDVASVLTTIAVRADKGPTPEEIRAILVENAARTMFVKGALEYLLAEVVLPDLGETSDAENEVLAAAFEPSEKLVKDLDKVKSIITAQPSTTRKRGDGAGSAENKSSLDQYVPGARFVHNDRQGNVSATLDVEADGTLTVTLANGEVRTSDKNGETLRVDNAGPKRSAEAASGNNENGYRYWSPAV